MLGWMKHKLESRLLGEISITSDMQMTPPLLRPLRGLQESRVATREESGVLGFPSRAAYQASPSMGFSRQEHWSGLPFPSLGDLSDPGIEPRSPISQAGSLPAEPQEEQHGSLPKVAVPRWRPQHGLLHQGCLAVVVAIPIWRVGGLLGVAGRLSGTVSP